MVLKKIKSSFKLIICTCKKEANFFRYYIKIKKKCNDFRKAKKEYWILAGTPVHGNLGDQAITLAEIQLLKEIDNEKEILEIPLLPLLMHHKFFKRIIGKEKILLNGGGFMGTLWMGGEVMVRNMIKTFKDNTIIIFPQTIFFEDDKTEEYSISEQIYSSHEKLHICTREKKSYDLACGMINEKNVHLIPDMVPYLKYDMKHISKKKKALLCLRSDKEKILSDTDKEKVQMLLGGRFNQTVEETDTVIEHNISAEMRENIVLQKIGQFAEAELIITDRLHGMVFAAIAGTPCVTLANCNYKIEGVYQWIKNNEYIRFIDDISQLDNVIEELLQKKNVTYDNEPLQDEYEKLKEIIRKV